MKIPVLWENEHLLVANKPAGILSQPDKSGGSDVAALLRSSLGLAFLAPVHRLDRNTSGCLLLAKSSGAAAQACRLLRAGKVKREYLAVVKGDPGERGSVDAPLRKDESTNQSSVDEEDGAAAVTHFTREKRMSATSVLRLRLEQGRSHQIRAHMAHVRCPLVGDRKYGRRPWSEIFHRPALHAQLLEFPDPASKRMIRVEAPVPEDLSELIQKLGG
ncbi:MAG: RluA family pseudouridine synthase [Bdellovibrionales bacterium]|nr:RluA family pseudouridine synthase [Bdellovibrionales bacterium]